MGPSRRKPFSLCSVMGSPDRHVRCARRARTRGAVGAVRPGWGGKEAVIYDRSRERIRKMRGGKLALLSASRGRERDATGELDAGAAPGCT